MKRFLLAARQFPSAGPGSQFRKNFIRIAQANVLAMALPLATTPLLTRLYAPDDFAALAVFTSVLALTLAFSTWRFDWSLPNARSKAMAVNLMVIGALVLGGICLASAVLALVADRFPFLASISQLGWLSLLFPVALLGGGAKLLFSGWFVRKGDLTAVSRATITQSINNAAFSVAGGFAGFGAAGLIGATVLSTWAGIMMMIRMSAGEIRQGLQRVSAYSLRVAATRYGREATWSTAVAILNSISLSAPILLLAYYYPAKEVGWYALMARLLAAPIGILGSALGQSFWSLAAELARTRRIAELSQLYRKTTLRLFLASIPLVAVCLAGPLFVGPLLGVEEWSGAGYVLQAMTPLLVGSLVFSPTNHLVVFSRQSVQTLVDGVRLVLVVGSILFASALEFDFTTAVALISVSSLIGHSILFPLHTRIHAQHG